MQGHVPLLAEVSSIMPYLIPIILPTVAILGAFAAGIVAMILKSKANERAHRERMFLTEKGLEIPRELYEVQEKKPSDLRATRAWLIVLGAMCMFIGVSVLIVLSIQNGIRDGVNGLIPLLIGVGFLASERMIVRLVIRPKQEHR